MQDEQVEKFAKKIVQFCSENGLKAILRVLMSKSEAKEGEPPPFKALHFPTSKGLIPKETSQKKDLSNPQEKKSEKANTKKISIDLLFRTKPLSKKFKKLYREAYDTHQCSRNQDIHLYRNVEIYERGRLTRKAIHGWKLPKAVIAKTHIGSFANQIQAPNRTSSHKHRIQRVILGAKNRLLQEERLNTHLELQRQMKERRDYPTQKSLFS